MADIGKSEESRPLVKVVHGRNIRELCRLLNSLAFPRLSGTCSRPERLKLLYRIPPHFLLSSVILFNI
jgi:hypothetical protein